jgi:formiminotetrahydrofolate cyclodeaminase
MFIVTTVAYMVAQIQRNKKRYGIITDIIEICIEEIEEKEDKNK